MGMRDAAERALEDELGTLNESIVQLRDKKGEVAEEIELLKRMKTELEADCNAKNKALHLDTLCLRLQLQSQRGGAADELGNTARSMQSSYSERPDTSRSYASCRSARSEVSAGSRMPSRPVTAASRPSTGMSQMSQSSSGTARHREIMKQLDR